MAQITETGTIDLKAQKAGHDDAAKTATNHIAADSTGIRIANANPATATTYQHQTATETEFVVDGTSMAEFGGNGARIGDTDECHVELDADSLNFVSGNSVPLVTMRIDPDSAQYWEATFTSDGTTEMYAVADEDRFVISPGTMTGYAVIVDGVRTSKGAIQYSTADGMQYIRGVWFAPGSIPEAGAQIVLSVTAAARASLIVGNGHASVMSNVGNNTIIGGVNSFASGDNSIAVGYGAGASGQASAGFGTSRATADYAFAAGLGSEATGQYSVALGYVAHAHAAHAVAIGRGVNAKSENQAVFGKYNENDTNGDYALIIGNGTADYTQARSNALTVDWDGVVDCGAIAPKWVTIDPSTFFSSMSSGWANDVSYTQLAYSPTLRRVVGRFRISSTAAHSAGNNVIGTVAAAYRPYVRALCNATTTEDYRMFIDAGGGATMALPSATTASTTSFYLVADYTMA